MIKSLKLTTLSRDLFLRLKRLSQGKIKPVFVWNSLFQSFFVTDGNSPYYESFISLMSQSHLTDLNDGTQINCAKVVKKLQSIGINPLIVEDASQGQFGNAALVQIDRDLSPEWQQFVDDCIEFSNKKPVTLDGKPAKPASTVHRNSVPETDDTWLLALNETSKVYIQTQQHFQTIVNTAKEDMENGEINERQFQALVASLKSAMGCPQPIYSTSPQSSRVWANGGVLSLSRKYRKMLINLMGWHEIDMTGCQFLIFASLFDMPTAQPYVDAIINDGKSLWTLLLPELHIPKDDMKKALYSIFFGASPKGDKFDHLGENREKFLAHPLMKDLLKCGQRWRQEVIRRGYFVDAYGNTKKLESFRGILSAMACYIQSYETALMREFELDLIQQQKIQLIYHLHDGCVVQCSDIDRLQGFLRMSQRRMDKIAASLGVVCRFDIKE